MSANLIELLRMSCEPIRFAGSMSPDREGRRRYKHLLISINHELAQAEAGKVPDGFQKSRVERQLRRLLAVRVAIPGAYYDDGEAQGYESGIAIDFMREPVADIEAKLCALNVARAIKAEQPAAHTHPDCGCCKGDGSMCKTTCRLAEESPPAVPANAFRLLADGEVMLSSDEFIDDDCTSWLKMERWAIGRPWHAGLKPVRRLLAAAGASQ